MNNMFVEYVPVLVSAVGALAFVVSVITEVTKRLPGFNKIPTDLEVLVLSISLTTLSFMAYVSYTAKSASWYLVVGSVIAGFFVAFIAMYGWSKLTDLYSRFKIK